jgi:hypothetical protein
LGRWASYYNIDCKRQVVGGSNPGRCANEYIVWLLIFFCPIQKLSMTCFFCTHWFPHYLFVLVTLCAPVFIYYLNFLLAPCDMFNKFPCNQKETVRNHTVFWLPARPQASMCSWSSAHGSHLWSSHNTLTPY